MHSKASVVFLCFSIIISSVCLYFSQIKVNAENTQSDGQWILDSTGWWYRNSDGSYPRNRWELIDGSWYYFDGDGYIYENSWRQINGAWYYFYPGGVMASNTWIGNYYVSNSGVWLPAGWVKDSTGWWYRNSDGSYPRNTWELINGSWYYFDGDGYIYENSWRQINGAWYYFYPGGVMASNTWIGNYYVSSIGVWLPAGWVKDSTGWWYRNSDGSYPRNRWELIDGSWYYFDGNGYIYENSWRQINGAWYYFYPGGVMASNTWIGNYYVKSDGAMTVNQWVGDYFVDDSGAWVPLSVSGSSKPEGIDISYVNGNIDLKPYKGKFVIIRAGYGWANDPSKVSAKTFSQLDKQFINNVKKCNELGIPYGLYWFSYATNEEEARKEAQTFINVTKGYTPPLGFWCDQEGDNWKTRNGWTWDKADSITKAFTDVMAQNGKKTGVYASYDPFRHYLTTGLPKWIAHYGNGQNGRSIDVSDAGNAKIHQYTSNPIDSDDLLVPLNRIFQ